MPPIKTSKIFEVPLDEVSESPGPKARVRRLVHAFREVYEDRGAVIGRHIERPDPVDRQINSWLLDSGASLVDVRTDVIVQELDDGVRRYSLHAMVVYDIEEEDRQESSIRRTALALTAQREVGGRLLMVKAMAGVFCVPEGEKFSGADDEAAPLPLLSPDFNAGVYDNLFDGATAKGA